MTFVFKTFSHGNSQHMSATDVKVTRGDLGKNKPFTADIFFAMKMHLLMIELIFVGSILKSFWG